MNMLYFWIAVAIVGVLIDIFTSNFFFICFSIGSIIAIISMLLNASLQVQFVIFGLISIAAIILLYPVIKKLMQSSIKRTPRMEETYIGRKLTADKNIINTAMIKVSGIYWTVRNNGETIEKGDEFVITGIEGTHLIVEKIKGV